MWLSFLIPSKFLCRYPLILGTNIFGIIMACLKIACIIVIGAEMVKFAGCESCTRSILRCAYGFSGTAIIYCIIMVCMHLWFLWAIRQGHSSVVLVWVVVTTMWLAQTFCLTLVLLFMFIGEASYTTWLLCFISGILAFSIAAYGVMVSFGLWIEMKQHIG